MLSKCDVPPLVAYQMKGALLATSPLPSTPARIRNLSLLSRTCILYVPHVMTQAGVNFIFTFLRLKEFFVVGVGLHRYIHVYICVESVRKKLHLKKKKKKKGLKQLHGKFLS